MPSRLKRCALWLPFLWLIATGQYVVDEMGHGTPVVNNTDTLTALHLEVMELQKENLRLQQQSLAERLKIQELQAMLDACAQNRGDQWSGCTKLEVKVPGYQRQWIPGIFLRIGNLRGYPHFSTESGDRHLYYTSDASGSSGKGNWVFADAVDTAYRAHVESEARSPELVTETWKVWTDGWRFEKGLTITCLASQNNVDHKALIIHDGCSDGHIFQGFCYKYFDTPETWGVAEERCNAWGGHLASVHSAQENAFCQTLGVGASGNFWFGLTLLDGHTYQWTDDTPVDYQFWDSSKDRQGLTTEQQQKQVQAEEGAAEWSHQPAEAELGYICKKAPRWRHAEQK